MRRFALLLFGVLCIFSVQTQAQTQQLRLAPYLCDSMILQCDMPVRICGQALPGADVEVSFAGQRAATQADGSGRWSTELLPMKASFENRTMEVQSGKERLSIRAVLVGEVWLAAGQSNMAFKVVGMEAKERLALARSANHPAMRLYYRANIVSGGKLLDTHDRPWSAAYGRSIYDWSAIAYLFARELQQRYNVPVAIINCSHGGSTAEAWISPEAFASDKELKAAIGKYYEGLNARFKNPSVLHTDMLEALRGVTLRGVIWYQGESNGYFPDKYRTLFTGLIANWRSFFNNEHLPFIFAQLPSYRVLGDKSNERWAQLRQAQLEVASTVPATAMVVTADYGDPDNIHPKNKYPVAMRFVAAARSAVYADSNIGTLTLPTQAEARGGRVLVVVGGIDDGLKVRGQAQGFELRDKTGAWHPARLRIRGRELILSSEQVKEPTQLRYAWGNINTLTVYHKSGIPLPPFTLKVQPQK